MGDKYFITPNKRLMTIGYEKKKIDQYIAALKAHEIKLLVDVRYNAFSRVADYRKKNLEKSCHDAQIDYLHYPDLGIKGEDRKNLKTKSDYLDLLKKHKKEVIDKNPDKAIYLLCLLNDKLRIALTCYEADHQYCHRTLIANAIMSCPYELLGENYKETLDIELIHF